MVGALLIVVGLLTLFWGQWLAPRMLWKVRARATSQGTAHYEAFFSRPLVRRIFASSAIVGCLTVGAGLVLLVTEL
jgi:hypothetical protein